MALNLEEIKKDWKVYLLILGMICILVLLFQLNTKITDLQTETAKLNSTLDSVEGIIISTDGNIVRMEKKIGVLESNIAYIVRKVRRK